LKGAAEGEQGEALLSRHITFLAWEKLGSEHAFYGRVEWGKGGLIKARDKAKRPPAWRDCAIRTERENSVELRTQVVQRGG